MRVIRKTGLLSLLVIATLFLQNASATLYLPISSYAEVQGNWQGEQLYTENGLEVTVEFAVYHTFSMTFDGEIAFINDLDLDNPYPYIYAYQIFDLAGSEEIMSFAIFGIGEYTLDVVEESISSVDDEQGGIAPTSNSFESSNTRGVWEFEGGTLIAGEHSWFLFFGSGSAPVPGSYEIKGSEVTLGVPEDAEEIPEPATMALLFIGGAMMISARRRRSV